MAYVLGFIFADGNIIYTKRRTWFLSIEVTDLEIVKKIKFKIKSSHKISKKKATESHKALYRLQIGSKEICNDLILLGLTPKKSLTICVPQIPQEYFLDFVRGYFDGDGGVWMGVKNKNINSHSMVISTYFTSGSQHFLEEVRKNLKERGMGEGSLIKKERGFDLKYSINDSLILYKLMYNGLIRGDSLFLRRKKAVFEKYMSLRS